MPAVRLRLTAVAVTAVVLVAACSGSDAELATSPTSPTSPTSSTTVAATQGSDNAVPGDAGLAQLNWSSCDDDVATNDRLRCATLSVPLDYDDPDGSSIDLALVMYPTSAADRIGAIVFNPGGPGSSGFDYVASGGATIAGELGLEQFDLIGFDPRGVDRSAGLRCLTNEQLDAYAYPDDTPDTAEEQAFLEESRRVFADACIERYGDTLQFYSTSNTARDIDRIRTATGDDQISFLGISYGTYLGAVYATMFPEHVRAMVLDSAFEPTGDTVEEQYTTQLVGFEQAFDEWAAWCADATCSFAGPADNSGQVADAWDDLRQLLDDSPIIGQDGRAANQALLERATRAALYSEIDWPVLGSALAMAANGDPSGLFRLADGFFSRDSDGTYATLQQSNKIINCASGIEATPPVDAEALADRLRALAPRFGRTIRADDLANGDGCIDLMPSQPISTIRFDGAAPVAVVGGLHDPATPFRWAEEMTAAMGPTARLITYSGPGHGQLLVSNCVTAAEAAVLTRLALPDVGTECGSDPEIERPPWWDSLPVPDGIDAITDAPELAAALGFAVTDLYAEIRTSDLLMTEVLAAYRPALEARNFAYLGEQEAIPGGTQAVYTAPNDDIFSILVLDRSAFDDPQLQSVGSLVAEGKVLVALIYLPSP